MAMTAAWAGTGVVVLRGTLTGSVMQSCRRCLAPVERAVDCDVTMVFAPPELLDDDEGETRRVERGEREIDLGPHLRDELILLVPRYVECRTDCRGFCAGCGADLNETDCQCSAEDMDPRWDALRALKSE